MVHSRILSFHNSVFERHNSVQVLTRGEEWTFVDYFSYHFVSLALPFH